MTGLHEALDDVAAEITPADPPVDLTMRRGRAIRNRRLTAVIAGTAGAVALVTGAAIAIPSLASGGGGPAGPVSGAGTAPAAAPADRAPLIRPVLLMAGPGNAPEFGDAGLVDAATLRLFRQLSCEPSANALDVSDHWKAAIGYTARQWNSPGSEVVSCDSHGTRYVLGKAVVLGPQVTSATVARAAAGQQWHVDVTLNAAGAAAFGRLTTSQYHSYSAGASAGNGDDQARASSAVILNGDVISAPVTEAPVTGGQLEIAGNEPAGFTRAEATALAARL
jgi:preprotein translocase subunit SecD